MIYRKHIIICLVFFSTVSFSQPFFTSIDTLLVHNFQTVNLRDSVSYLKLLNRQAVYKDQKASSSNDSMTVMKPFTDAFSDLIASLADMVSDQDFTIRYNGYELMNRKDAGANKNGRIRMHVALVVNNTVLIKIPFTVTVSNGLYSIDSPMMVMFLEQKE